MKSRPHPAALVFCLCSIALLLSTYATIWAFHWTGW